MLHRDAGATSQESEVQDGGSQPQMPAEGVITWQGKKENTISTLEYPIKDKILSERKTCNLPTKDFVVCFPLRQMRQKCILYNVFILRTQLEIMSSQNGILVTY